MGIPMSSTATRSIRWATAIGVALLIAALALLPGRSSPGAAASETLVASALPSSPAAAAVSPDGSWRLFRTTGSWYRSQNGGAFTAIPAPPVTGGPSDPIIRNDGSVVVGDAAAAWSALFKSTFTVRLYESGSRVGPFTIGQGQQWNDTSLVLASNGTTLVALAGRYGGKVFSSVDSGRTWLDHGAQTAISTWASSGGRLYMVDTAGGFRRWTYSTRSFETPNTTANISGEVLVDPISPSTIYAVRTNTNGTVTIHRSLNDGTSWSIIANAEPFPYRASATYARGVSFGSPRIEADGNIHVFGSVLESGVGVVYEAAWDPTATAWTVPTRFATSVSGSALLVWPNRRADGSIIGPSDRWITRSVTSTFESYSLNGAGTPDPTVTTTQGSNGMRVLAAGGASLSSVAYSPDQQWRLVTTSTHLWRSQNGTSWEGVPRPPISNIPIADAAIRNDGTLVIAGARSFGTVLVKAEVTALYFENGQWLGPVVVGRAGTWNDTTLSLADNSSELLIVTGRGATRYSQSGGEWAASTDLLGGGRVDVIGDVAHVVSGTTYQRWSFISNAAMSFIDPVTAAVTNSLTVPANSRIVRTPGSTSEVWIASPGTSLTLRRSTDGGTTYEATPVVSEALPSGVNAPFLAVSSDSRVHLYATAACSSSTLVYSTSHALGATSGFSPFVGHYLDETKTATIAIPTGGSGVGGAGPDLWFSVNQSGALLVQLSNASTVSIESVYGMDPFGVSVGGVNGAIGSYSTSVTDAKIASVGPELSITRTYNSADQRVGIFGRGWSTNLESRVFENCVTGDAVVLLGDGARMPFTKTGATYAPAPGVTSTLVKTGGSTWTLTSRDGIVHTFDVNGRITSITDADGRVKQYTRNGQNQIIAITDQTSARSINLTYTNGFVTAIESSAVTQGGTTAPLRWNLAYNGNELSKVCEPRNNSLTTGNCTTYTMLDGRLTQITDPNGHADQVIAYAGGRVAWQENGAGDRVTYTYNGSQTQVTDELNRTTTYSFDNRYRLLSETNPRNGTTVHEYNAAGFRWKTTDPNSLMTTRTFDAQGNVLSETNGNNETTSYSYDAFNNRLTVRDGRSANGSDTTYAVTTTWTGATRRQLSESTPPTPQQPTGTTRTWGYTDGTEVAIGGSGSMPAGLLETVTDPNGNTATYRYDNKGNLRETTSPLGLLTTFTYDELGRKITETSYPTGHPSGVTTTFTYDGLGNIVQTDGAAVTNPISGVARRQRIVTVFDPANNPTSTVMSDIGGSASPDPARTTTRTFDDADRPLTITDPEGGVTTHVYDVAGNLVQVTDARGFVHQYGFDANNMPTSETVIAAVTDPGAPTPRNVTLYTKVYDTAGRLTSTTDPLGRTTEYGYDNANRQTTTTLLNFDNRNATVRNIVLESVVFDAAGNPTSKTTAGGLRSETFVYDQAGRLTGSTLDPAGINRATTFVYDPNGNVLTKTVTANGRSEQTRFTYSAANLPLTQTIENGATDLVTSYGYDNRGLQTSSVEPRGNLVGATAADFRTDLTYDPLGRQTRVQSPPVAVTTVNAAAGTTSTATARPEINIGYNAFGDQTHRRDERSNTTTQSFDRLGRVVTITHPAYTNPVGTTITPTEQMVYDPNGNLTSKTDRRGEITTWVFDGLNRATRQTDPQVGANPAGTTDTGYDDAGNQLVVIDQRGARIEYTYDDLNRVRTRVDVVRNATPTPNRYTTTYDYDDLGNTTYQQTPTGDVSTAVFNAASEMTSSTDPGPFTTTYTRDVAGRVTVQTDPLNRRTETDYDLAGRATTVRNYDSVGSLITTRTTGYDAAGNPTSYVSPRGNVAGATAAHFTTTITYDALSRVTSVVEPTTATTSITTSYAYDAAGNLTRLTDGRSNQTLYDYQAWNLQAAVIEPATTAHNTVPLRTYTTTFDAGGLATQLVEPGPVTVTRTYDDLGRLTNETGSGTGATSATRTYTYDAAGLMTTVNAPGGNITYTYDDRRLLTSSDGPATTYDSSFTYDPSGRMLSRTDNTGTSNFTWNSRNLLATATNPLLTVTATHTYDSAGQRTLTTYTGGGTRTYTYDGLGRLTNNTLRNSTNTVTAGFDLGYDPDSNITRRTITLPGNSQQGIHTYTYDNVGRLTSWTRPASTALTYAWDAAGNLTTNAGTAQTFDQRNRILTSGTTTWTWTPRGTMATQKIGTAALTNLTFDGLNRMTASSGQNFTYDGLSRVATNGTTNFSYAATELDPTAIGTTLITRGPNGEPVASKIGTATAALLGTDPHNDITHLFAGSGSVSATRLYEPFGKPTITSGTMPAIGFQGDYTNPTTGDVWMGARWYKPNSAAFTARDTIFGQLDTPISLNRHTYAWADPLGMWDPDGREPGCGATANSKDSCKTAHQEANTEFEDRILRIVLPTSYCTGECTSLSRKTYRETQVSVVTVRDWQALEEGSRRDLAHLSVDLCLGVEGLTEQAVIPGAHKACAEMDAEYERLGGARCSFDLWGNKCFSVQNGVDGVLEAKWDILANAATLGVYDCLKRTGEYIGDQTAPGSDAAWAVASCGLSAAQLSAARTATVASTVTSNADDAAARIAATNTVDDLVGSAKPWDLQRTETLVGRGSQAKVDDIAASMRENGWVGDPIEVFQANGQNYIVNGHHRVAAARQAGIDVQYRVISQTELLTYYPGGVNQLVSAASEARPGRVR